jgi:hypothetical protein
MFTREKTWYYLARLIGLPAIYEERTGEEASWVRELWYQERMDELAAYVPASVAIDLEMLAQNKAYIRQLLLSKTKPTKYDFLTLDNE